MEEKNRQAQQALLSAGTLAKELEELRGREALKTADANQAKTLLSALAAAAQEVLDRDEAVRQELRSLEQRLEAARLTPPLPTARSGMPGKSGTG